MSKQQLKSTLKTTSEAEEKLLFLASVETALIEKEAEMNQRIKDIEKEFDKQTKNLIEKKNAAYQALELFANENKKLMKQTTQGGSNLKLKYGTLSFRKSTGKIELLRKVKYGMKKAADDLFGMFSNRYVRTTYEVNKEALADDYRKCVIGDVELSSVNLKYNDGTDFNIKINWKQLESEGVKKVNVKKAS